MEQKEAINMEQYNVIWNTPSKDSSGSMPLGNGELGVNVWCDDSGDVLLYLARTDAWSEISRLLKITRIRLSFGNVKINHFRQTLHVNDGFISLEINDIRLAIHVAADADMVVIEGSSELEYSVSVRNENWRTERHIISKSEQSSAWTMRDAPFELSEDADCFGVHKEDEIFSCHYNESSIYHFTLANQSLEDFYQESDDPIIHRRFGVLIKASGFAAENETLLKSAGRISKFKIMAATSSGQDTPLASFLEHCEQQFSCGSMEKNKKFWHEFWSKSFIHSDDEEVNQAYVLQKMVMASAGTGNYPIKYNGSLFTYDPQHCATKNNDYNHTPDFRRWGDCYWYQNTRLIYLPMLTMGCFEQIHPFIKMYFNIMKLAMFRSEKYFGVRGYYIPETITFYGAHSNRDYGWPVQRHVAHTPFYQSWCPYTRYMWNGTIELLSFLVEYYEYTHDQNYLTEILEPMATEIIDFFARRFPCGADGKMIISPSHGLETYQKDVANDTPTLAGLLYTLPRLLNIAEFEKHHSFWQDVLDSIPPLPYAEDGSLKPAYEYINERSNLENVEFYTIYPFRIFGVNHKADFATRIYDNRIEKEIRGWQYAGMTAAGSGLADEAWRILKTNIANRSIDLLRNGSCKTPRFPAFWGPNYDWMPDQTHASNLLNTLQMMLLQSIGDKIYILPAWPQDRDVKFKLHASAMTTVECEWIAGKINKLTVIPRERCCDIVYPAWISAEDIADMNKSRAEQEK